MRKLIAWILLACLLFGAVPALAEATDEDVARVAVNLQAIKVMLDDYELKFTYSEESDTFLLGYSIESAIDGCYLYLTAYDDGVFVQADYDYEVPQEKWEETLRFCALCSEPTRMGCFYLDRENATVGYKFFIYSDVLPPTQAALAYVLELAVNMLEYRGDALSAVLNDGATAEEALNITLR